MFMTVSKQYLESVELILQHPLDFEKSLLFLLQLLQTAKHGLRRALLHSCKESSRCHSTIHSCEMKQLR